MRIFFSIVAVIIVLVHIVLEFTNKTYLYKAVANTYLKGRSGPSILEYGIFRNRSLEAEDPEPIARSHEYNKPTLRKSTLKKIEQYQPVALLVVKNDSLLFERYWEGHDTSSISNSFSMAKTVVSILTGIALKEGKIKSIDDPVTAYIPELNKKKNYDRITIRHLLTMSSGINFDEDYKDPFAYPAAAYYGKDLYELSIAYDAAEEPGKQFKYLSGNTQLLGFVLQEATGRNLSEYAEDKLWGPLNAQTEALWNLDREDGDEKAYCCLIATARDFSRIGQLYLHKGNWKGKQIVDSAYVAESITPAPLVDEKGKPVTRYGYSWWLVSYKGKDVFYARGILGQYILCIPDLNVVVVRLGHKRHPVPADHPEDLFLYLDAALEIAGNN